jgi:hypothetical protein
MRGSRHTSGRCATRALFEIKELNVPASEAEKFKQFYRIIDIEERVSAVLKCVAP